MKRIQEKVRAQIESKTLKGIKYVRGRTNWDKMSVRSVNEKVKYFHTELIMREPFYQGGWDIESAIANKIFVPQMRIPYKGMFVLLKAIKIVKQEFPDIKVFVPGDCLRQGIKSNGYRKDSISDTRIVDLLCRMYDEVYLWLQGMGDYEYAKSLGILERVKIVSPSLIAYDELLDDENIEYIGTRLHGGIRALQHGRRTMIIAVDGRAWEKKKDFNLPVILRNELSSTTLENLIVQERTTDIVIPTDNIQAWKKQFKL